MFFFILNSGGRLQFSSGIIPYSIAFAAAFGTAIATATFAVKTGPLSITALVTSYSLLIPTGYGILFLHDPIHSSLYVGLAMLAAALYLINKKGNENIKISRLWIVYIILAFVSNGMCSTIQKMQQLKFEGAYKNEFMIIALAIASAALFIYGFCQKDIKKEMIKPCLKYGFIKGSLNGLLNYLVMVLTASLPNSVLFPSISAGGIILTFICSLTIYKERLSKRQIAGYMLGILSIIFLNL